MAPTTPPPDDDVPVRLTRYLAGELSEQEEVAFLRWLDEDSDRRRLLEEYQELWMRAGTPPGAWNTRAAFERFRAARAAKVVPIRRVVPPRPLATRASWSWPIRVAAALVLAAALGTYVVWHVSTREPVPASAPTMLAMKTVTTRPGERATLQLSDGTRVTLGVASTLRYPEDFAGGTRAVELEGEAYFEVRHDARRPFAVRTPRAVVHDIGTSFVVRAYADIPHTDVVVTEGQVSLAAASSAHGPATGRPVDPAAPDSVLLNPSDRGRLDGRGRLSLVRGVDTNAVLAWTRGRLVFANTPVREVVAELRRWYGDDVRVGDDVVARRPFTAAFDNAPVDVVLHALAVATGARVERRGSTITISAAGEKTKGAR